MYIHELVLLSRDSSRMPASHDQVREGIAAWRHADGLKPLYQISTTRSAPGWCLLQVDDRGPMGVREIAWAARDAGYEVFELEDPGYDLAINLTSGPAPRVELTSEKPAFPFQASTAFGSRDCRTFDQALSFVYDRLDRSPAKFEERLEVRQHSEHEWHLFGFEAVGALDQWQCVLELRERLGVAVQAAVPRETRRLATIVRLPS